MFLAAILWIQKLLSIVLRVAKFATVTIFVVTYYTKTFLYCVKLIQVVCYVGVIHTEAVFDPRNVSLGVVFTSWPVKSITTVVALESLIFCFIFSDIFSCFWNFDGSLNSKNFVLPSAAYCLQTF